MNIAAIVALAKECRGIKTAIRDNYLTAIANGVVTELTDEKGIVLDENDTNHLLFCAHYVVLRYLESNPGSGTSKDLNDLRRSVQYRLHNLMVHSPAPVEGETP